MTLFHILCIFYGYSPGVCILSMKSSLEIEQSLVCRIFENIVYTLILLTFLTGSELDHSSIPTSPPCSPTNQATKSHSRQSISPSCSHLHVTSPQVPYTWLNSSHLLFVPFKAASSQSALHIHVVSIPHSCLLVNACFFWLTLILHALYFSLQWFAWI